MAAGRFWVFAWGCNCCLPRAKKSRRAGLGIFDGRIRRIPGGPGLKVPHIGWNDVQLTQTNGIFRGVAQNSYFYFVHSFYLDGAKPEEVAGVTRYGVPISARCSGARWLPRSSTRKRAVQRACSC